MVGKSDLEKEEQILTEPLNFRIEQDVLDELRKESKQKMQDLDLLINKILKFYFEWHKPSTIGGNIPFSKALLARIFNNLNDEQIHKIAEEYVKYEFKEQMRMVGLEDTISSYIKGLCRWLEMSGFPYRHDESNNADIYTIRFDMGTGYSVFFGKYIQLIAEHFELGNSKLEVTNNTVTFKIQRT
jgi:hypothetical protein